MQVDQGGVGMKNQKWATALDVPDPTPLPKLPGYHILVRPYPAPEKVGSIYLTQQVQDDVGFLLTVGKVLVVGDQAYKGLDAGGAPRFEKPWCKVGDWVVYGKYTGTKVDYKGVKLIQMNDDHISMVIEKPEDFLFNIVPGRAQY